MCVKNASNDTWAWSAAASATFEIGTSTWSELGFLVVLQHHALAALLANHALVVRQVERCRLHAAVGVAGREHRVDDAIGASAPRAGCVLRIDRQVFSISCSDEPEALQLSPISAWSLTVMNASNAAL
jgi:hypothetical protein